MLAIAKPESGIGGLIGNILFNEALVIAGLLRNVLFNEALVIAGLLGNIPFNKALVIAGLLGNILFNKALVIAGLLGNIPFNKALVIAGLLGNIPLIKRGWYTACVLISIEVTILSAWTSATRRSYAIFCSLLEHLCVRRCLQNIRQKNESL
jgi:hypothetical protein